MKVTFKKEQSKAGHFDCPRDVTYALFVFEDGNDVQAVGWEDDIAKLTICPPDEALPWCAAQWYLALPDVSKNHMMVVEACKRAMAEFYAAVPA